MYWTSEAGFADRSPIAQRIIVILHRFSSGGSERVAVRLANAWAAAGRHVTILCGDAHGPLRPHVSPRVAVLPIEPRGLGGSRTALGRAAAGMVRGLRPDVVVGPGNHHVPILRAMQDDLDWDRPGIVCKLSNPLYRADRSRLGQALFGARIRRQTAGFDTLVAMSPAFAAEASVMLGRRDVACIAEPSLDAPVAYPAPPAPRADPRRQVLLIGRLSRQKNVGLALAALARTAPDIALTILGEGEEDVALRARATALGIAERVTFAGFVDDVPARLRQADALLCTSRYEGYPAALVEALAAGLPVVSTPCSLALPEILRDRSFGAIAGPDPDDLARTLELVLRERRRPAAPALAELTRRHQLATAAREWLDLLDGVVARRGVALANA